MKALLFLLFINTAFAELTPLATLDSSQQMRMHATQTAQFKIAYKMPNGMNHKMFHRMHGKLMHTIIVNKDLSHFAHVHPEFDMRTGEFKLNINGTSNDPDNQSLSQAIPWFGQYYLFTETMPHQHDGSEMTMLNTRHQIDADGTRGAPAADENWPDARDPIEYYFSQNGENLRATLDYETYDFCDRWVPKFYLNVKKQLENGDWVAAKRFEKWLEMGGHAVMIEKSERQFEQLRFQHLHAFLPMATASEFDYPFDPHVDELQTGQYKIWFQIKRDGEVLTIPFAITYQKPIQTIDKNQKCK